VVWALIANLLLPSERAEIVAQENGDELMFHNQMTNFLEWPHIGPSATLGRGIELVALAFGITFVAKLWRDLFRELRSSYRPELHYMRGPGPRWREKHGAVLAHDGGIPG
jgi:transposase